MVKDKNTEEQILEAAKKVFEKKGMNGARMQEIADAAGINKALLHYYYRSKEKLFEAVFSQAVKIMLPKLTSILNNDIDLEEKIRKLSDTYISFILKHPYLPHFILNELNRNPEFIERVLSKNNLPDITKFKQQIETEIKAGRIRDISPNQLFINIMSLNVFPFVGAPLLKLIANIDGETYKKMLNERKKEVPEFIINAIKL